MTSQAPLTHLAHPKGQTLKQQGFAGLALDVYFGRGVRWLPLGSQLDKQAAAAGRLVTNMDVQVRIARAHL